jgi:hypothetical protein
VKAAFEGAIVLGYLMKFYKKNFTL